MSSGMASAWPVDASSGTLGVEEEFVLVDPATGLTLAHVESVMAGGSARVTREFVQELVESCTPVCTSGRELLEAMVELREALTRDAARSGASIAGVGVHAFTAPEDLTLTDTDRYRGMSAALPWTWREATTCGMHVHVGVPDPDRAIEVCDRLRSYLPVLLAMSANSPLWRGRPTGMSSIRTALRRLQPRTGIPPRHGSWRGFTDRMEALARAGVPDGSWTWWGVRPHPTYGTVEVRVFDTQSHIRNAHALAMLTSALVGHLLASDEESDPFAVDDDEVLAESWYNAMRGGPDGLHAVGRGGSLQTQSLAESGLELIELVEDRLGSGAVRRLQAIAVAPEATLQLRDYDRAGCAGAMRRAARRTTTTSLDAGSDPGAIETPPSTALARPAG